MDLMTRRHALMARADAGSDIPKEYKPVVKLISDGKQVIDTGLALPFEVGIYFWFKFQVLKITKSIQIYMSSSFLAGTSNSSVQLPIMSDHRLRADRRNFSNYFGTPVLDEICVYEQEGNTVTCLGNTISGISGKVTNGTHLTFCMQSSRAASTAATMGFFGAKYIDTNDNVVMDLRPVLRKSDMKPGMYDVARDLFLVNDSGVGEFGYETYEGIIVPAQSE